MYNSFGKIQISAVLGSHVYVRSLIKREATDGVISGGDANTSAFLRVR